MHIQPIFDQLAQLRLIGMRSALEQQLAQPRYSDLSFEERLGLLLDVELTRRANNRLARLIRAAKFPITASLSDLDLTTQRGLDPAQIRHLAQADWVSRHLNTIILGATGAGKTFLGCVLGRAACEANYSVRYWRTSRLLQALHLAHADGSYPKLLRSLAKTQLLILDDWLRDPLSRPQARDLLEILDDRYGRAATCLISQVPTTDWHSRIPDPTLADALLDRILHSAYRLNLTGESRRKLHSPRAIAFSKKKGMVGREGME